MRKADTYVRARIDTDTKEDAIRLLMFRVVDEGRLPFDVKGPNEASRKAIAELESGKGGRYDSVDALMTAMHCVVIGPATANATSSPTCC
jgi:DNA-damage-inducible protein J